MSEVQLVVDGVSVSFGGLSAVRDVSLTISRGDIVGLIGPNGAGKTTLMNVVSGLQAPTMGRILLTDTEVTRWPTYKRARAGLARTFQDVRLFRHLTVFENALAGALGNGLSGKAATARTQETLERFDLAGNAHDVAESLSNVQQRQLAIARALTARPEFVLLDEPAAGLSETESDHLLSTLRTARGEIGCGLLIIEHDMRLIMRLCETIHVLNEGATLAVGPPAAIQRDPEVLTAYLGE